MRLMTWRALSTSPYAAANAHNFTDRELAITAL